MRGELHYDVVVIGAGTAGLTAGARLAEGGARVCVVAKGVGSTHLAPGTIDVLGYAPGRVSSPAAAIEELAAARPDHPYALLGVDTVTEAVRWFASTVESGPLPGYRYIGETEKNLLLPTAVGALRPSALVPETMAAGDMAGGNGGSVCIVGTRSLRDFHGALCATNLTRAGVEARAVDIEIEVTRADENALGLARRFDDPAWRAAFAARLALKLGADQRVGLPAMLGARDPHGAWSDLEQRLGRPVFEIPTLPPSVPGMRVFETLRTALRRAGGRLIIGAEVVDVERDGARIRSVATTAAGHEASYSAPWFVLAAGSFSSGAIALDSRWETHDQVLGLPLRGAPATGEPRFVGDYLAEQPMARVGVAVGADLRADGAENVLVVGAALPGAVSWREMSGEGIALASGSRAAQHVLAQAGASAGAAA
ncbi:MAG TPA: anaerobic glycerol-3-phosphate dehydrogenase subunit GlpB [Solirubrobacteraceae bacterium]|nr:anaerobic glycerol-3-phosphate dehydrogenase subunit GlpB [Solirubrobacteraceae bacterium]